MPIDISRARDGEIYTFAEQIIIDKSDLNDPNAQSNAVCCVNGTYVTDKSEAYVNATCEIKITTLCADCMETVELLLVADMDETYSLKAARGRAYTGMKIDLTDAVREQIQLEYPIKSVCSDECMGLCPVCGVNLNKDSCACIRESDQAENEDENPFSVLKK